MKDQDSGLNRFEEERLKRNKRELSDCTIIEQDRKMKKGKVICIETGGKSNRVFFRKPKRGKRCIRCQLVIAV